MPAASTPSTQVRIDAPFMFSNHKDVHKPGIEKRQRKLLQKIPFMDAFLAPDEKVLLVTPCVSPTSIWEQLTTGWVFALLNRALLVVTNKSIFHIPTKMDYGYRQSIARLRYDDCKEVRVRGRHLTVRYESGKKERYLYLPRAQRLKLKRYVQNVPVGARAVATAGKSHLCPRCTRPIAKGAYQCGSCRLAFKDMATAMKISLWLPGGGYFYTGHPILGIGDFIFEFVLLALTIESVVGMTQGRPGSGVGAVLFGAILAIEKLITIQHAKRYISEYIPKQKNVELQSAAA